LRENASEEGQGFGYRLKSPLGNIGLSSADRSKPPGGRELLPKEVSEVKTQRRGPVALIFRVLAPVAGDDVEPSVTVQIASW